MSCRSAKSSSNPIIRDVVIHHVSHHLCFAPFAALLSCQYSAFCSSELRRFSAVQLQTTALMKYHPNWLQSRPAYQGLSDSASLAWTRVHSSCLCTRRNSRHCTSILPDGSARVTPCTAPLPCRSLLISLCRTGTSLLAACRYGCDP